MDPFSALSIATSVLQFLDFTTKLLSSSSEIFRSVHGASSSTLALESSCSAMKALSEKLSSSTETQCGEFALKMKKLADDCKADCDALLAILQKLKVECHKNRRWESLKVALKTVWGAHEIRELEGRIDKARHLVAIYVQDLTMYVDWRHQAPPSGLFRFSLIIIARNDIKRLRSELRGLQDEGLRLQLDQTISFNRLSEDLNDLKLSVDYSVDETRVQKFNDTQMIQSIQRIVKKLQNVHEYLEVKKRQNLILSSLSFPSRTTRHDAISEASATTFQWILDSTLSQWLQEDGDGVFWVFGRAGSGKSTLIKFLADHPLTFDLLQKWAHPQPVIVASHYFWSAGTSEQQSQRGLLQTLIYDVFRACPEIIPVLCPSRWETVKLYQSQAWTVTELTSIIQSISEDSSLGRRFCWFIDGLDEYGGDSGALCDFLVPLTKSKNLKLCVSSRPMNVFIDAFDSSPQLAIHEYTRNDVANFARERLQSHRRWLSCSADRIEKERLISDIRDKANGVFLWVYLVTMSLRDGLTNDDDLGELRKRLEAMPSEIEQLFKQMLDSINAVYHEKMAQTFLLALQAYEIPDLTWPFMFDALVHHENEETDHSYAIHAPLRIPPKADLDSQRSRMRRRLNARSHGLLETSGKEIETVVFLHRTVRDFLRTGEMVQYLKSKVNTSFDAALSMVKAYIVVVKSRDFQGEDDRWTYRREAPGQAGGYLHSHLLDCFEFGARVDERNMGSLCNLIDELEKSVVTMFESGQAYHEGPNCHPSLPFREALLQSHLYPKVAGHLARRGDYFAAFEAPPLFIAIVPGTIALEVIEYLLTQHHCDPNEMSEWILQGTPWLAFVWTMSNGTVPHIIQSQVLKLFLTFGADPNALNRGCSAFSMFLSVSLYSRITVAFADALDSFIDAGASLDVEVRISGVKITVAQEFCNDLNALNAQHSLNSGLRRKRMDAAHRTAQRLITRGLVSTASITQFEQTFRDCFDGEMARELVKLLGEVHEDTRTKRKLEGVWNSQNFKKMRTISSSQCP